MCHANGNTSGKLRPAGVQPHCLPTTSESSELKQASGTETCQANGNMSDKQKHSIGNTSGKWKCVRQMETRQAKGNMSCKWRHVRCATTLSSYNF